MITVIEAKNIIENTVPLLKNQENRALSASVGYILSEDVISPINMPPFRQSAMDGYALNLHNKNEYTTIGEIQAGDHKHPILQAGEAVRIFTGAPVPDTANAIIMQENVSIRDKEITINSLVVLNDHIRPLGEQVKKGTLALKKGTKLTPASIGYLTSLGIVTVAVYKKPRIAIIATGNELVQAGELLKYGQIYESNTCMLQSVLSSLGYEDSTIYNVNDDYTNTYNLLEKVISEYDVVMISGGISVGDYDFVGKALNDLSVKQLFYKVKQKPGKPLYYGKKNETIIFALPGNPAAALTCFYVYVQTALEKLSGNLNYNLDTIHLKSASKFHKKGNRAQFLKALITNDGVEILEGQSSAMLQTFALANALVYVSEEQSNIDIGDNVQVIRLPN